MDSTIEALSQNATIEIMGLCFLFMVAHGLTMAIVAVKLV